MNPAQVVTDLGNLFVASAGAGVVFLFVWMRISRLVGAVFGVCVGGVVLAAAGLKLISHLVSPPPWLAAPFELSSGAPSGHAALATVVYGCAAVVFLKAGRSVVGAFGALLAVSAVAGVSITRVTLGAHTLPDVIAGLLVGLPAVAVFARGLEVQAGQRRAPVGPLLIGLVLVLTLALASGVRLSSTRFL
jgi:membrane-associated phospholipid phosphatase